MNEGLIFLVVMGSLFLFSMGFKMKIGFSLMLSSIIGAFCGGFFFPIRHLVEGPFGYFDAIIIIATAMVFMKCLEYSGMLDLTGQLLVTKFKDRPQIFLILVSLFIMFPAMFTGSSTAAVLTTGTIIAPILIKMGLKKEKIAAIIALNAVYGEVAPPINIPALLIGGGVDMPFVGFTLPLLILTIPLAVIFTLILGRGLNKEVELDFKMEKMNWLLFVPLIVVVILTVLPRIFRGVIPSLGMPLTFMIGAIVAIFTGKKYNFLKAAVEGTREGMPILIILVGVGMFLQVMTLTGVRGFIVVNLLSMPALLLYLAIAVGLPLLGGVSVYGAASVLGVPFTLALLGRNDIIVVSAITLLVAMGDFMPPAAFSARFAAQVTGVGYKDVFKQTWIPQIITMFVGIVVLYFAKQLGFLAI